MWIYNITGIIFVDRIRQVDSLMFISFSPVNVRRKIKKSTKTLHLRVQISLFGINTETHSVCDSRTVLNRAR